MLAVIRKARIRDLLSEKKSVSITELAGLLSVTRETVRRDLKEMEKAGELVRTHGGAYILDGVKNDLDADTRQVLLIPEKEAIAKKSAALIKPGDFIFLDGSTTCWFIARALESQPVTVLTGSLEIANILSKSDTVKLHLLGGEYSKANREFGGFAAVEFLTRHYVDKAFISCRSVHLSCGITDTNEASAAIRKAVLSHANKKYLVADHSKLDKVSFSFIAPVSAVDGIIMDSEFSKEWKTELDKLSVKYY